MTKETPPKSCQWDWWPLARLLVTGCALATVSSFFFGARIDLHHWMSMPQRILEVIGLLALLSFTLAELYFALLMLPFYVLLILNDGFYYMTQWVLQSVFGLRSRYLLAGLSLCGGTSLFCGSIYLIKLILGRF